MIVTRSERSNPIAAPSRKLVWIGVIFALVFPTLITWGYFVFAASYSTGVQQTIYLVGEGHSVCVSARLGVARVARAAAIRGGRTRGACCLAPCSAWWSSARAGWCSISYLRDTTVFADAAPMIRDKIAQIRHRLGVEVRRCWACSTRCSIRCWKNTTGDGLCFGQLRRLVPLWPAIVVSALGVHGASCDRAWRVLQRSAVAGVAVVVGGGGRRRVLGLAVRSHRFALQSWLSHL